uniref:Uncharacterized protein n=1 Tax=Romanomermis culicivorax TaxID=13658 RepID=A0A915I0L8_ROMCU
MDEQGHHLLYLKDLLENCTHVTYNCKNNVCFLQHTDRKHQILGTQYYSFNHASCAYYSDENRFLAAASQNSIKPGTATSLDSVLENYCSDKNKISNFAIANQSICQYFVFGGVKGAGFNHILDDV